MVAISILAMVIFFAGSIFKSSIGAYRTASAQAEIMQKLRVIGSQLDSDFKGLRKDAPMFIWFQQDPFDPTIRYDQIMFFADGDFQSTRLYDFNSSTFKVPSLTGSPVISNTARIQYGQAMMYSQRALGYVDPCEQNSRDINNNDRILNVYHRTLAKRQHLLTAETDIIHWPDTSFSAFDTVRNDAYEHDTNSISQWYAAMQQNTIVNQVIGVCFNDVNRPHINLADASTLHLLMSQGIGSFAIQWDYNDFPTGKRVYWWPSHDPANIGNTSESDFPFNGYPAFGFYFNMAAPNPAILNWYNPIQASGFYYPAGAKPLFPHALRFTFKIYDSRGVFKDGQTFTHIVYLGDL